MRPELELLQSLIISWEERPSWDDYFMAATLLLASRSPSDRLHVGCVLVSPEPHPHRIIAAGYNGFLSGAPHHPRIRDDHELSTVHAEQNAVTDAARRGTSLDGATAYISHYPCIHCFKILSASGIKKITYLSDYKNDPFVEALAAEAGIAVVQHVFKKPLQPES